MIKSGGINLGVEERLSDQNNLKMLGKNKVFFYCNNNYYSILLRYRKIK
jgi:hypothetical protein